MQFKDKSRNAPIGLFCLIQIYSFLMSNQLILIFTDSYSFSSKDEKKKKQQHML